MDRSLVGLPLPMVHLLISKTLLTHVFQKRSSRIHELELRHQNALHQTAIVSKDESARRLKLKSHILQDSKGSLQEQLSEKNEHISKMMAKYQQMVNELQEVKETVRKRDVQIKSQSRDFSHLQVCAIFSWLAWQLRTPYRIAMLTHPSGRATIP